MSEKLFKIKKGDEIIIEIPRTVLPPSGAQTSAHAAPQKGMIPVPREEEYLPRRASSGWRFFDLGQAAFDDYFNDVSFEADASITPDYDARTVATSDIKTEDLQAKAEFYLSQTVEALRANYFKINRINADAFLISIQTPSIPQTMLTPESDRWKSDTVVKINPDDALDYLIVRGTPLFAQLYIDTRPAFRHYGAKITLEPNFDSIEATDFVFGKKADFFLTPSFGFTNVFNTGHKNHDGGRGDLFHDFEEIVNGNGETIGHRIIESDYASFGIVQTLYTNYPTFPRNEFIDLMILWRLGNFQMTQISGYQTIELENYELFYRVSQYLKTLEGTRNFRILSGRDAQPDQSGNIGNYTPMKYVLEDSENAPRQNWTFPVPDLFPAPPALPNDDDGSTFGVDGEPTGAGGDWGYPRQFYAGWSATTQSGDLRAIIFQTGKTYYVWER